MSVSLVLLTRVLRVHDHPALAAACRTSRQVPLFVVDPRLLNGLHRSPNRATFLAQSLADLDGSLRGLGGALVVRRGDPVDEAIRLAREVGAGELHVSADVTGYAQRRQRRLDLACHELGLTLHVHPGVTVVPAGALRPADGDHYRVFTPYWRRWVGTPRRPLEPVPPGVRLPDGLDPGPLPAAEDLATGPRSPRLPIGGEEPARRRLAGWLRRGLAEYGQHHNDLAGDRTSRLAPYLHLGCLSALEVAVRADGRPGAEPFLRQLCWRDFHHQVLHARPDLPRRDYRLGKRVWRDRPEALAAWRDGRTGCPVVDAGMRQLREEGWMPNRARLLTASFLVKRLGVDWRLGAAHFFEWLVDGDVANNVGNWQWVAGTGNDPRPDRVFDPVRQGRRFDPAGDYVRRYVPERRTMRGGEVHEA
ncbi:MAG TPA: deoxyribodipyrimidine photo-lyase [Candidatus Dormibacteraeota bacterium]|nr:deoxyribodipyrimidine photo-lyase [Candidatus Dormibacteraeota bacterium]